MPRKNLSSWMWGDALSLLEQAERLQRQFFRDGPNPSRCWEPPVDVLETRDAVIIYIALPGVSASGIYVGFDATGIVVSGERRFPGARPGMRIHRIELPHGRFERRISLPLHALEPEAPEWVDGCLILTLKKIKEAI